MFTSIKLWVVWISILVLIGILGYGFTKNPKKVPSPLVGGFAPDFELKLMNSDRRISLKDLKGKPALLNFWASWCQECKIEAKILETFYKEFGLEKGKLKILGIAVQDDPKKAIDFANFYGKTYYIGLDDKEGSIALDYGIYGVPETFFLDPDGKIFYKHIGLVSIDLLGEKFKPFL